MELKEKLQDYTRAELEQLVKKITDVSGTLSEHNQLISHFDRLVKHPKGADLLFYPDEEFLAAGTYGVGEIVFNVKKWHNDNGQLAFSDDAFPPVRQKSSDARPSAEDRARAASAEKLVKTQKVIRQIEEAQQNVESVFSDLDTLLKTEKAHPGVNCERYISLETQLSSIEAALHAVVLGVYRFGSLEMTVRFAKDDATRSISYSHLDQGLQSSILQLISVANEKYHAQKTECAARHLALHIRAQALMTDLEEQLIRLASVTGVGPSKDRSAFTAIADAADVLPQILTTYSEISSSFERNRSGLIRAIRSAVSGLAWESVSERDELVTKHASVISFRLDTPGCGEKFAVSVPLSELLPASDWDWRHLAQANAEVDLPFRMSSDVAKMRSGKLSHGLKEITELAHVYVVPTNGTSIASKVKVRTAVWDAESGAYRFVRPGLPRNEVQWMSQSSAIVDHDSGSSRKRSARPGYIAPVRVPVVEAIPVIEDLSFDDCIVVFPYESGIEPVYIMFKGSREYPGVATGVGQPSNDDWLQDAATEKGAAIPSAIADQLRNKVFKRFSFFREAFWKGIANSPELGAQFSTEDLASMGEGRAPAANMQSGKLEIRYVISPEEGGDVYDMDNMRIVAPSGV
jgi:hypothetical protein